MSNLLSDANTWLWFFNIYFCPSIYKANIREVCMGCNIPQVSLLSAGYFM